MDEATKKVVRLRAEDCCEYCRVPQSRYPDFTFHIEHIIARQHGGDSSLENLALACHHCNGKKGPNIAGLDPESGALTRLYHPRRDVWTTHFHLQKDGHILGRSTTGRTTVYVLDMNTLMRVEIRLALLELNLWR